MENQLNEGVNSEEMLFVSESLQRRLEQLDAINSIYRKGHKSRPSDSVAQTFIPNL